MNTTTIVGAAVILNVSTEYMVRLLDEGRIPFRLEMEDVLAYKAERDRLRNEGLKDLTRLTQEAGLYDLQHSMNTVTILRDTGSLDVACSIGYEGFRILFDNPTVDIHIGDRIRTPYGIRVVCNVTRFREYTSVETNLVSE